MGELLDAINLYLDKVSKNRMDSSIVIGFSIVLIVLFILRYAIAIGLEHKKPKLLRTNKLYIGYHVLTELVLTYSATYILIKITDANVNNIIFNMVAAPGLCMMGAYLFDKKIFIPFEQGKGLNSGDDDDKKKDKKKDGGGGVTININNDGAESKDNEKKELKTDIKVKHLEEEDVYEEEFASTLVDMLNNIQENQAAHDGVIKDHDKKLDDMMSILNLLRESEMLNKKIELKKLMYNCLNKGYVTPEENDKVVTYYKSYTDLGGNHEVKSLYENHYVKLKIRNNVELMEAEAEEKVNNTRNISDIKLNDVKLIDFLQPPKQEVPEPVNCIYGMYDGDDDPYKNLTGLADVEGTAVEVD